MKNLVVEKFGRLTSLCRSGKRNNRFVWLLLMRMRELGSCRFFSTAERNDEILRLLKEGHHKDGSHHARSIHGER